MTRRACWIVPIALAALAGVGARPPVAGRTEPAIASNSIGMRLAQIPAGSFDMGSNIRAPEQPVRRVSVRAFWLGVTEVTQAQWLAVVGSNPSHFKNAGLDAPVEMVTWEAARGFIEKLNGRDRTWRHRLPSEAEWEYACRAGGAADSYGPADDIAWVMENSGGTTHPVGQKRPNAFGLYDMLGNVPEWTQDTWHPDYKGAPSDGSAWEDTTSRFHTLRGGGWDLPAFFLHAALRDTWAPVHRLGFRVVAERR
ncbi:MAG TPA: formylglycine-generating enzyme family protein [Vicinamibacterales bacterium]|jgi:formylglycine-generating enzyme required for sulfatase activity